MATRTQRRRSARSLPPALRAFGVLAFLYLFLVGVSLLESGIGALGGDVQERLFERVGNPVAGLS